LLFLVKDTPADATQLKDTLTKLLDKQRRAALLKTISHRSAPNYACEADGMIRFYTQPGEPFCIYFNVQPECAHVYFRMDGYAYSKVIKSEGIRQLQAFKAEALKR